MHAGLLICPLIAAMLTLMAAGVDSQVQVFYLVAPLLEDKIGPWLKYIDAYATHALSLSNTKQASTKVA